MVMRKLFWLVERGEGRICHGNRAASKYWLRHVPVKSGRLGFKVSGWCVVLFRVVYDGFRVFGSGVRIVHYQKAHNPNRKYIGALR